MGVVSLVSEMDALPNGAKLRAVGLCSAEILRAKVGRNRPKSLAVATYMAHTVQAVNVLITLESYGQHAISSFFFYS